MIYEFRKYEGGKAKYKESLAFLMLCDDDTLAFQLAISLDRFIGGGGIVWNREKGKMQRLAYEYDRGMDLHAFNRIV
jgi:hypothetical protein